MSGSYGQKLTEKLLTLTNLFLLQH